MIAGGARMTLYVNGSRVLDNVRVAATEGVYGLVMRANSMGSRCVFDDVWVFETAGLRLGICEVTPDGLVTRRAGPGLGYSPRGDMRYGRGEYAISFMRDRYEKSLRWWKLEDGTFVREDVVIEAGDCDTLPEDVPVTPTPPATATPVPAATAAPVSQSDKFKNILAAFSSAGVRGV
jgi:hypothetical protein